jgi:hypothetical protein
MNNLLDLFELAAMNYRYSNEGDSGVVYGIGLVGHGLQVLARHSLTE